MLLIAKIESITSNTGVIIVPIRCTIFDGFSESQTEREKNTTVNINKDKAIKIYAAQLIVNSIWTLIFFGFKLYLFAFIWLLLLLVLIIIMIYIFYKIKKVTLYLLLPYLIWVIFAGYLNFGIYLLNR